MSVFEIIVTGLRTGRHNTGLLFQFPGGKILLYLPPSNRPDQLWGTPSTLCNDYRGLFLGTGTARIVNLLSDLHPATRLRMGGATLSLHNMAVHRVKFIFAFTQHFAHD